MASLASTHDIEIIGSGVGEGMGVGVGIIIDKAISQSQGPVTHTK